MFDVKVGFFYQDVGVTSRPYLDIARYLLASVRKVMPGTEVWQLTDGKSPALDGVDEVHRIADDMPMGVRRLTHYSMLPGNWLFVDTDVVIQKDVSPVFHFEFDVALTDRDGTYMAGTPYAKAMPFNFGVIFSRSPAFWTTAREYLLMFPPKYQEWEGEQRTIAHIHSLGLYKIKVLPGEIYNYPPLSGEEDLSHAAIVHYKGAAKKYMGRHDEARSVG